MNYLLVMPKRLGRIDHFDIFPIGLAYVSAAMKKSGISVFTANLEYMEGTTTDNMRALIATHAIDVVCVGGLSGDYIKIRDVIDTTRRINPALIIIAGGGIISSDPEVALNALGADIGVIGEGEMTMCALASCLDADTSYDVVPGIIFRDEAGEIVRTSAGKEIENLNELPFPDFHGFGYEHWVESTGAGIILTDRSCPFNCTFCYHPTGSTYRHRTLDNIFAEIDYQLEHFKLKGLGLSSELFSLKPERVLEFSRRIKPYNIQWGCSLRVPDVSRELLRVMKEANCINLVLGLESADNSILKSMRKGVVVEQIQAALDATYAENIMIEGGFIFGDIAETEKTAQRTLDFWRANNDQHYLNLSMIRVFPGSHIYHYACEKGIITDREQFLKDGCPLVNISQLDETNFQRLKTKIFELRLHPHVPAAAVTIISFDGDECHVRYVCRKCGHRAVEHTSFWFGNEYRCPVCRMTNYVDPFRGVEKNWEFFVRELPMDTEYVLWGGGGIYYKLVAAYPELKNNSFVLVDINKELNGFEFCEKQVSEPEVLRERGVTSVIITALSRRQEILDMLQEHYPTVCDIFIPSVAYVDGNFKAFLRRI